MLTDSEKAAARFKIIMEKLNPILEDATTGTCRPEATSRTSSRRSSTTSQTKHRRGRCRAR